jgi:2-polyprenyl-3-methyl-5-hydroxy-6-metoxy-1,4-benzoquinol methylase
MKWGAHPHPFQEASRKCFDELWHQLNLDKTRLIGFGADARKLYFQLTFIERAEDDADVILDRARKRAFAHELLSLPFELTPIVKHLVENCWEPAAEAGLLMLSVQRFGRDRVVEALRAVEDQWRRKLMLDEWDLRAGQAGLLPVMSVRYPERSRERLSHGYVDAVMRFIGSDVSGKRVLDVGCGIGRLTARLAAKARSVRAIDLCERMLHKARERVRSQNARGNVRFARCFAQDHQVSGRYDVTICSLVLVHNVADDEFRDVVAMMCRSSKMVLVFEDVTSRRATSPHTRLRTKDTLKKEFLGQGFVLSKEATFNLHSDTLAFLKFTREKGGRRDRRVRPRTRHRGS